MALLYVAYPDIAEEWDYFATENLTVSLKEITTGSGIKRGWVCKACSHKWLTSPHSRTGRNKTGCPGECKKKRFAETRYVKKVNQGRLLSIQNPEIFKQWDTNSLLNQNIIVENLLAGDPKKYGWKCNKDHTWEASLGVRVNQKTGCPYCSHHKILVGFNDFGTLHPHLLEEFNYERNDISPTKILGAPKIKVWWKCKEKHEWKTSFDVRARGRECPQCSQKQTSKIEQKFHKQLTQVLTDINPDHAFSIVTKTGKKWKPDIVGFYQNIPIIVEYDGAWWHKEREIKDLEKSKSLIEEGYYIIRIREEPLPYINWFNENFFQIKFNYDKGSVEETTNRIKKILEEIIKNENNRHSI